jgi:hypothetical protein
MANKKITPTTQMNSPEEKPAEAPVSPAATLSQPTIEKMARRMEETALSLRRMAGISDIPTPKDQPKDSVSLGLQEELHDNDVLIVCRLEVYNREGLICKVSNRSTLPDILHKTAYGAAPRLFTGTLHDNVLMPGQNRFMTFVNSLHGQPPITALEDDGGGYTRPPGQPPLRLSGDQFEAD